MKLWSGRFQKETNQIVDDFHSSISFDRRLYAQDIRGSMAHAKMLCRQGIISPADEAAIQEGLKGILADMQEGKITFPPESEDIHMLVESILTNVFRRDVLRDTFNLVPQSRPSAYDIFPMNL